MPDVVRIRRLLHKHPELSGREERSAEMIAAELHEIGVPLHTGIGGHGILARIEGGHRPWVALRADMDALPIQDGKKSCAYSSAVAGVAHACGHDAHCAMLIGAARVLQRMREDLPYNIACIFQPAEEIAAGAAAMIKDGVLRALPKIERIHALHVYPYLPAGSIGLREGVVCAAAEMFEVEIEGLGGHAARPHECIDVILISSHIIQALNHIISRRVNPLHPAVLSVGQIHAGSAANVIPGRLHFSGTVRSLYPETHEEIRLRMDRIIRQTAESWGATAHFTMRQAIPVLRNDAEALRIARKNLGTYLPDTPLIDIESPSMGGEDFAVFLESVPGALLRLGTGGGPSTRYPLHHPCFDIDESAMATGVAALVALCL